MSFAYQHDICDLCHSPDYDVLLALDTGRVMTSDSRVITSSMEKYRCKHCGLVRSGAAFTALDQYYTQDYTLNTKPIDHYFHTASGAISRSQLLRDWFISSMGGYRWRLAARCLEVGAGNGWLLREFSQAFPEVQFDGIELSEKAVAFANQQGIPVVQSTLEDFAGQDYDIIYAMGVLEHVPSPTHFLAEIRERLAPGGLLYLCQPTQDVPSYDVFFVDHIHHFGSDHLRQYAAKCGFRELGFVVGHEFIPNFSLHLWQASEATTDYHWTGGAGYTTCLQTVKAISESMDRLNATLDDLRDAKAAVFGLGEVYALVRANSRLGDFPIACGLDDVADRPEYAHLGFPVVRPEDCVGLGIRDVILTINTVYYDRVIPRLESLGLRVHPVLDRDWQKAR